MTKPSLTAAPLALLLVAGCPASIIDLSYYPAMSSSAASSTGGTGGGGTSSTAGASTGGPGTGGTTGCNPGATAPCYDGPLGTEGVGLCKGGARTCSPDGAAWGPCVGEVLPPCLGNFMWATRFGDATDQHAMSIAADPSGNVLVTGYYAGAVDFGGGPLTSVGQDDIFLAKLDASSAHVWSKSFGDGSEQRATSVAVDGSGNVLVTGYFSPEFEKFRPSGGTRRADLPGI